ncbi:MAG: hypothetical protein ACYCWW_05245 [Deltaproteobacteria bacterium]
MATSLLGRFNEAGFLRRSRGSELLLDLALRLRGSRGLSPAGARALASAIECLVPRTALAATSAPPDAPQLQAITFRAQRELYTLAPRDRRDLCAFLDLLERVVPLLAGTGLRFSAQSPDARARCLQLCERSSIGILATGHAAVRHLALVAFLEAPELWPTPRA